MLKKSLLIAGTFVFALSAFSITDKKVERTTSNGGPDGYNETSYHEDGLSITIKCTSPGYESCPAVPTIVGSGIGVDYALKKISENVLTGDDTIVDPNGNKYRVVWSSRDASGYTSEIKVLPL